MELMEQKTYCTCKAQEMLVQSGAFWRKDHSCELFRKPPNAQKLRESRNPLAHLLSPSNSSEKKSAEIQLFCPLWCNIYCGCNYSLSTCHPFSLRQGEVNVKTLV